MRAAKNQDFIAVENLITLLKANTTRPIILALRFNGLLITLFINKLKTLALGKGTTNLKNKHSDN